MKQLLLALVLVLTGLGTLSAQNIYFVKAGSNGNGSSWSNAFGDLQQALRVAKYGDQIWVAKGTYRPTKGTDREASFVIPDGVALYGGFEGSETYPQYRNGHSILSGEIGSSSLDDNSYSIVYTKNVSLATVVDGFIITGGAANAPESKGNPKRCGAGWFNDGSFGESSPTIINCEFVNNYAMDGAGLYNYAKNGACRPQLSNCKFEANRSELDGGAIYNDGNNGICTPWIIQTVFVANEATYGAGLFNQGDHGETKPVLQNCLFSANVSFIRGSSIFNNRDQGISDAVLQGCRFENNKAPSGDDVSGTGNYFVDRRTQTSYGGYQTSGH